MSTVKNKSYVNIQGWMVAELGLSGNELLVYAIIYGFSQDGEGEFTGSLRYLMDWTGASKNTVMRALVSLEEKGLISKQKITTNGVVLCKYKAISELNGGFQNCTGGGAKIEPNNKDNNLVIPPPISPQWDERFDVFWAAYPRKAGIDKAREAFKRRKPSDDMLRDMLKAIAAQKQSDQWQRDGGQYIPHPATWLNQGRWQDETPETEQSGHVRRMMFDGG